MISEQQKTARLPPDNKAGTNWTNYANPVVQLTVKSCELVIYKMWAVISLGGAYVFVAGPLYIDSVESVKTLKGLDDLFFQELKFFF